MRRGWPWVLFAMLLAGWWLGGDGTVDLAQRLQGPSAAHLFGTDELGRDLLARFLLGGARSLTLGAGITVLNLSMGLLAALGAHPFAGIRHLLLALADVLASIPATLLALLLLALLRPGLGSLVVALTAGGWIPYARLALNQLDALASEPSILQVRLMGGTSVHRIVHHVLPRLWPVLGSQASVGLGFVVLVEGGLSFLGVGLSPDLASWGTMLASGRTFLLASPWGLIWPALGMLALLIAVDELRKGIGNRFGW